MCIFGIVDNNVLKVTSFLGVHSKKIFKQQQSKVKKAAKQIKATNEMLRARVQRSTTNFVFGLTVGLVFAFLTLTYLSTGDSLLSHHKPKPGLVADRDLDALKQQQETHDIVHETFEKINALVNPVKPVDFNDHAHHHDDDSAAKLLYDKVRILCWVMTSPQNLDKKAIHVKKTWGHRCNKLIFISSVTNDSFPTVGLNVSEGREHLTGKTMLAFRHVFDNYMDEADWFMKADDDTYVILENLRYLLSEEDTNKPIYFGHHFKTIVKQGYFSGGAGYVLSKEAMRRFARHGQNASYCRQDGGAEDAEFGKCMENLEVKVGNSTDSQGRSRFHCFDPETHLNGGYPNWYYQYDANGAHKGNDYISDYAVSFHYVPPQKMYALEYYVYHLRPYGIQSGKQDINQKHTTSNSTA